MVESCAGAAQRSIAPLSETADSTDPVDLALPPTPTVGWMPDDVDPLGDPAPADVPLYALGALVYAERGDQILLLRRAGGVLSGQWYLPGGAVEAGETPEQGAIRELVEESGLSPDGDMHLVGVYPVWQYGREWLHVSYRCKGRRRRRSE